MSEAIYCFDKVSVRFAIYPEGFDGARILAEVSEDALRGVFGARGGGAALVEACDLHFEWIAERALQVYRRQPQQPITLESSDFSLAESWA